MNRFLRGEGPDPARAGGRPAVVDEKAFLWAAGVVHDYGVAMSSISAAGRGCIADVRRLPHPKERIKEALALMLGATDEADLRERLKSSYLLLADWQEGVGDTIVPMRLPEEAVDVSAAGAAKSAAWEAWEKWRPRVLQEERALKAELQERGLW